MSLKAIYESFLANPNPAALGRDVSLNYITTTTTVTGADEVVKHLASQQRIVKKKSDKILSAIEAPASLVLDVETTLEFVAGGGAYLPSLDDNFLADRVVTFPTVSPSRAMSRKIYLLLISDFCRYTLSVSTRKAWSNTSDFTGTRDHCSSKSTSSALADATGPFAMRRTKQN
jgi:hypothetical protein